MDEVLLGRWQFGITTVYHYLFVPITIAMSMLVAVMQTIWYKTGNDNYLRLTKFFGKLFLINFALGVVTGIVQEFQFGMNWSEYSRFVGDVFGAPLALEALLAFFLESTFIGLWIFGWDRLPKKIHLLTIYAAAFGTMLSAVFILAANSWMQHPVGTIFNPETGRAEIDGVSGFLEVLTNPVLFVTFPHVISGAYMVAGGLLAGIAGWHLARLRKEGEAASEKDKHAYRFGAKFGAWVLIGASVVVIITGDLQSKIMFEVQPVKMAAAEAQFDDNPRGDFSILTIGNLDGTEEIFTIPIPGLLHVLAGSDDIAGINELREEWHTEGFLRADGTRTQVQEQFAAYLQEQHPEADGFAEALALAYPGLEQMDPIPNVMISYWMFRLMIGAGLAGVAIGIFLLWSIRKDRLPKGGKIFTALMFAMPLLPLAGNGFGWIFTEMGRQPWLVAGTMPTTIGISPSVPASSVVTSLIIYTLLYGALAVIEVGLFLKYAKKGLPDVEPVELHEGDDSPLSFAY